MPGQGRLRAAAVLGALMPLLLAGCAVQKRPGGYYQDDGPMPDVVVEAEAIPDAVPTEEPRSKWGNPPSYEVFGQTYKVMATAEGFKERGYASWYGKKFHGRRTSNGERYDMFAMTAAHKSLPLPSYVRVTHLGNGRSVVVRVNDRGPFHKGRIIDLSYAAAAKLGMIEQGSAEVEIEVVRPERPDTVALAPYLEVGSFSDPIDAVALREELAALGLPDLIVRPAVHQGQEWHRVLAGPFTEVTSFRRARQKLLGRNLPARPVDE